MQQTLPQPLELRYRREKWAKLALCVALDIVGNITYFLPALGEAGDLPLAPLTSAALGLIFWRNGKGASVGGGLFNLFEEIMPMTDFLPSATLTWLWVYIKKREETYNSFLLRHAAE